MNLKRTTFGLTVVGIGFALAPGCGGSARDYGAANGGSVGNGGTVASGGKHSSAAGEDGRGTGGAGGEPTVTGGATSLGGAAGAGGVGPESEGGAGAQGGASAEGGAPALGGTQGLGGAPALCGAPALGGMVGTGGIVVVAPETRLTATPPNPDRLTSATFQFSSTIATSTFQCKLDSGNYAACTSPRVVTISGDGAHAFSVYASAAGVDDATPATYTWTLDTVAPTLRITSTPAAVTSATTASFGFTAETGATLACHVDSAAFAACTSATAHTLSGLATGNHTFEVRATDAANNQTVQAYTWYIEPPCTSVLIEAESLLPATGWALASGSVLHNSQAIGDQGINSPLSFTFQGKGLIVYYRKGPSTSVGKHSVAIDGGTAVVISGVDANGFSYQQPTTVATGLANAVHTATLTCLTSTCQIDYFSVTCN